VARAAAHGLQYLGDTDVQSMFPWSLGERTEALVQGLEDQVEQEQYLDFVRNRTFRQTLLCRAERPLERVIDLERLDRFAACSALEPPRKLDLRGRKPVPFRTADGRTFEVRHQLTRSALLVLGRAYPNAVPLPELRAQAAQAVAQAGAPAEATETDHLFGELFSLFAHGAVVFDTRTRHYPTPPPGHPRASALARVQAAAGLGHLATARHSTLSLDPFAARLVGYLDGSLGREDLVDRLVGDIRAGRIAIEGPAASAERLRVQVAANCDRLLALFGRHGVLSDRPA
jgi:methyltransferase-like protein